MKINIKLKDNQIRENGYYTCCEPVNTPDAMFEGGAGWLKGKVIRARVIQRGLRGPFFPNSTSVVIWDRAASPGLGVWSHAVREASEEEIREYKDKYECI